MEDEHEFSAEEGGVMNTDVSSQRHYRVYKCKVSS